jgi:CheY-like chemotaxis protein
MAGILIAEALNSDGMLQQLLRPTHEVVTAVDMKSALAELKKDTFDLVIIDLHFDESRMFDLMQVIHAMPRYANKPIICIASRSTSITQVVYEGMSFTARALGAWMFLDLYKKHQGTHDELLRIIERCLTGEARRITQAARLDLHQHRQKIHKLRMEIQNEEWSPELEEKLADMREKLTTLLEHCELHMESLSQQETIDESRELKDRVSESVTQAEDKATRIERKANAQRSASGR